MFDKCLVCISGRCNRCRKGYSVVRWLPRRRWKEFGKVETLVCKNCRSVMENIRVEKVDIDLVLKNNAVYVRFSFFPHLYKLLELDSNKVLFHIPNFPKGFAPKIDIFSVRLDKEGRHIGEELLMSMKRTKTSKNSVSDRFIFSLGEAFNKIIKR